MSDRKISQAVISRLPRYLRYLGDLKDEGVERISSHDLSVRMHVTASQIRQDFNHFGGFGQQGYGYNVGYLYDEIAKIIKHDIEIAVLTLPKMGATEIVGKLVDSGIKGIWNFAHVDLELPENVIVENVHLSESLMKLSYKLSRGEDSDI